MFARVKKSGGASICRLLKIVERAEKLFSGLYLQLAVWTGFMPRVTEWTVNHDVLNLPAKHVLTFALGFDNDFFKPGSDLRLGFPPGGGIPSVKFSTKDESWAFWYNGHMAFC